MDRVPLFAMHSRNLPVVIVTHWVTPPPPSVWRHLWMVPYQEGSSIILSHTLYRIPILLSAAHSHSLRTASLNTSIGRYRNLRKTPPTPGWRLWYMVLVPWLFSQIQCWPCQIKTLRFYIGKWCFPPRFEIGVTGFTLPIQFEWEERDTAANDNAALFGFKLWRQHILKAKLPSWR